MSTQSPDDWTPASPGEVERLAGRLALRAKLRLAAAAGAVALAFGVVAAGGWYAATALAKAPGTRHPASDCGGDPDSSAVPEPGGMKHGSVK
jgi:hypothetical protein